MPPAIKSQNTERTEWRRFLDRLNIAANVYHQFINRLKEDFQSLIRALKSEAEEEAAQQQPDETPQLTPVLAPLAVELIWDSFAEEFIEALTKLFAMIGTMKSRLENGEQLADEDVNNLIDQTNVVVFRAYQNPRLVPHLPQLGLAPIAHVSDPQLQPVFGPVPYVPVKHEDHEREAQQLSLQPQGPRPQQQQQQQIDVLSDMDRILRSIHNPSSDKAAALLVTALHNRALFFSSSFQNYLDSNQTNNCVLGVSPGANSIFHLQPPQSPQPPGLGMVGTHCDDDDDDDDDELHGHSLAFFKGRQLQQQQQQQLVSCGSSRSE